MVEQKNPIVAELHTGIDKILGERIKQPGGLGRQELQDAMFSCGEMLLFDLPEGLPIDAHGFAKVSTWHQCDQLVNLLTNGIDRSRNFNTAPLSVPSDEAGLYGAALGTSGGTAYKDGAFIIISDPGKSLTGTGPGDGIKAVLVNPALHPLVPILQKHFNIPILTYDKLGGYLFSIGAMSEERQKKVNKKMRETMKEICEMHEEDTSLFSDLPAIVPPSTLRDKTLAPHATSKVKPEFEPFMGKNCTINSYNGAKGKMLALKITNDDAQTRASAETTLLALGIKQQDIQRKRNMILVLGSDAQEVLRSICIARGENPDILTGRVAGS